MKLLLSVAAIAMLAANVNAQQAPAACRSSEMMDQYYSAHPEAINEEASDMEFAANQLLAGTMSKSTAVDTYRVAVVFHIYGTVQNGKTVNDNLIKGAVAKLNQDFHGLNNDYNTVHSQYLALRSPKNIKFYLAKKDPNGNNTTGIIYHPVANGFGNANGYDALIQADAWNNRKYINVYVQAELYDDGVTNNSGVAWLPNTGMMNNNLARIVYNGAYIHTNTDPEFASTMTHEFGHFFNLLHTFEGGCTTPNDKVADTPPCTSGQGCHATTTSNAPLNCNNQLINAENYMDYNVGCYKMFTKGQEKRMDTALYMPSRITLWQDTTNIITGIDTPINTAVASVRIDSDVKIYPNPSNGLVTVEALSNKSFNVEVVNALGQVVYQQSAVKGKKVIDLGDRTKGMYFLFVTDETGISKTKLMIQ